MSFLGKGLLWVIWAITAIIWIYSIAIGVSEGHVALLIGAFGVIFLLFVLYYAEGLEIAVADLRDKDAATLGNKSSRRILAEIQHNAEYFFAQRQIFVVAIISFVALLMEKGVDRFEIPFLGSTDSKIATFTINFLFLNLTVLWFCQVAPKRLAVLNSEDFLTRSGKIWPVIKLVGGLNIPGPAEDIAQALAQRLGFSRRRLPPSRASLYSVSARILGTAIDSCSTNITLNRDGSARVVRRYLQLFTHGKHQVVSGGISVGPATMQLGVERLTINVVGFARLAAVEDFREYADVLNEAFRTGSLNLPMGQLQQIPSEAIPYGLETYSQSSNAVRWTITTSKALPEYFWGNDDGVRNQEVVALLYEAILDAPPGSFTTPGDDSWKDSVGSSPCRRVEFVVATNEPDFTIGPITVEASSTYRLTAMDDETRRCNEEYSDNGCIAFPPPSTNIEFKWQLMPISSTPSGKWSS